MRERNRTLRKRAFETDNFTCQKCKIQDKTARILEAHHIIPIFVENLDTLENIMTLCQDCHRFAPTNKQEFDDYMKEETDGTTTTLIKSLNIVRKEHPELI